MYKKWELKNNFKLSWQVENCLSLSSCNWYVQLILLTKGGLFHFQMSQAFTSFNSLPCAMSVGQTAWIQMLSHLPAVWAQANQLTSLSLNFSYL